MGKLIFGLLLLAAFLWFMYEFVKYQHFREVNEEKFGHLRDHIENTNDKLTEIAFEQKELEVEEIIADIEDDIEKRRKQLRKQKDSQV